MICLCGKMTGKERKRDRERESDVMIVRGMVWDGKVGVELFCFQGQPENKSGVTQN